MDFQDDKQMSGSEKGGEKVAKKQTAEKKDEKLDDSSSSDEVDAKKWQKVSDMKAIPVDEVEGQDNIGQHEEQSSSEKEVKTSKPPAARKLTKFQKRVIEVQKKVRLKKGIEGLDHDGEIEKVFPDKDTSVPKGKPKLDYEKYIS